MNKRDATFTGKVSEWGLLDGTLLLNDMGGVARVYCKSTFVDCADSLTENPLTSVNLTYKIKSLPDGYKFNDAGDIVEIEVKRYWDGKKPLEVGMLFTTKAQKNKWRIECIHNKNVFASCGDKSACFNVEFVKPVDARTDKQKAVDEVYRSDLNVRENLANAYDKWVSNDKT